MLILKDFLALGLALATADSKGLIGFGRKPPRRVRFLSIETYLSTGLLESSKFVEAKHFAKNKNSTIEA